MKLWITLLLPIMLGACTTGLKTDNPANTESPDIDIVDICDPKNVHSIGVTDALTDKKMNAAFLTTCDKSKRLDLRKSYKTGYKQGLVQKKESNRSISGK